MVTAGSGTALGASTRIIRLKPSSAQRSAPNSNLNSISAAASANSRQAISRMASRDYMQTSAQSLLSGATSARRTRRMRISQIPNVTGYHEKIRAVHSTGVSPTPGDVIPVLHSISAGDNLDCADQVANLVSDSPASKQIPTGDLLALARKGIQPAKHQCGSTIVQKEIKRSKIANETIKK